MINLQKKYPSIILKNITEKDIIYFCRDALSKKENHSLYDEEILNLIQYKKWNWNHEDIDRNIILTYPVYNNSIKIVKFLFENVYDTKVYDEKISNALCACINLRGDEMLAFILSNEINKTYVDDLVYRCYFMSNRAVSYAKRYVGMAEKIMKNSDFKYVANKIIHTDGMVNSFSHFIFKHEMDKYEKIQVLNKLFETEIQFYKKMNNNFKEKQDELARLKLLFDLEKNLKTNSIEKRGKKI